MAQFFYNFVGVRSGALHPQNVARAAATGLVSTSPFVRNFSASPGGFVVDTLKPNYAYVMPFGSAAANTQVELLLRMRRSRLNSTQNAALGCGVFMNGAKPGSFNNYHSVVHGTVATHLRTVSNVRSVDGSATTVASSTTLLSTLHGSGDFEEYSTLLRVRKTAAGEFSAKAWWSNEAEPASFTALGADATLNGGEYGVLVQSNNAQVVVESLGVGTGGDAATSSPLLAAKTISGTVTDDAGTPAARTVYAILRATGVIVASTTSNASTGAYSLQVQVGDGVGEEVDIVCLDDDAGALYNDRIDRVLLT